MRADTAQPPAAHEPQQHQQQQQQQGLSLEEFPSLGSEEQQAAVPSAPSSHRYAAQTRTRTQQRPPAQQQRQQHKQHQQQQEQQQQQQWAQPSTSASTSSSSRPNFALTARRTAEENALAEHGGPKPVQPRAASWVARAAPSGGVPDSSTASRAARAPTMEYKYIKAPDFKSRNAKLLKKLKEIMPKSDYDEFMSMSSAFRSDYISAFEYATKCQELLGKHFEKMYADLVVLFPDLAVQTSMVEAWRKMHAPAPKIRVGRSQPRQARAKHAQPTNQHWRYCQYCHQVVSPNELGTHESHHDVQQEEEFPSLLRVPKHKPKKKTAGVWGK